MKSFVLALLLVLGPAMAIRAPSRQLTAENTPKVRGCIGPLYGTINWNAVTGWIKYHEERWGLNHVDMFVRAEDLSKTAKEFMESVPLDFQAKVNVTSLPPSKREEPYKHQLWLMGECLSNAKENNDDFLFNFDSDEYLISDDFSNLTEMFEFAGRPGVSFPVFPNNYHRCSKNKPEYASATYQSMVPLGAEKEGSEGGYTDPPPGVLAHRKYIVIPHHFDELKSVHDPFGHYARPAGFEGLKHGGDDEDVFYMTGRGGDHHHARVIHMRTDVGIQADDSEIVCQITENCKYLTQDAKCVNDPALADYVNEHTSLNEVLGGLPLTDNAMDLYHEAVCYAKRYADIYSGFCQNDENKCRYDGIRTHYQEIGKPSNLIWGCRERQTTPATPVASNMSLFDKLQMTYKQYQNPLKLHFVLYETDHHEAANSEILAWQQSSRLGIKTTVVGGGSSFDGFASKWAAVRSVLDDLPSDALVVVGDSRDMFLNIKSSYNDQNAAMSFIKTYQTLTLHNPDAVVFSTEGQCCVAALLHAHPGDYFDASTGLRAKRSCNSGDKDCLWPGDALKLPWESFQQDLSKERTGAQLEDVYLNAGLVAGRPVDLVRLIDTVDLEATEDDQAVFTDLMYHYPDRIVLDYAQELFGTARWPLGMSNGGCPFESDNDEGPLVHRETKTSPLFLHFPGKFWQCHDATARKLGIDISDHRERGLIGSNYGRAPEVLGFFLIEATSNEEIGPILTGDVINLWAVGTELNIRADVLGLPGSVVLTLNAKKPRTENLAPYALFGDKDGDYLPGTFPLGENIVTATPYEGEQATGAVGIPLSITFTVVNEPPEVIGFALIDASTNLEIGPIQTGDVINLSEVGTELNIRAFVSGLPGSVVLILNATEPRTENVAPYAVFGDIDGVYLPGTLPLGENSVTAIPYQGPDAAGAVGILLTVTFDVIQEAPICTVGEYTCVDFSETGSGSDLKHGDYVKWEWRERYGMTVKAYTTNGGYTPYRSARIYDTATIGGEDPDLGSPNERCGVPGPGVGEGGEPDMPGENCIPQGNVVIIQESNKPEPNDNAMGGSINFLFDPPVKEFLTVSILDIDGKTNSIEAYDKYQKVLDRPIESLGDNAFQVEDVDVKYARKIKINASHSFGVSEICFCY